MTAIRSSGHSKGLMPWVPMKLLAADLDLALFPRVIGVVDHPAGQPKQPLFAVFQIAISVFVMFCLPVTRSRLMEIRPAAFRFAPAGSGSHVCDARPDISGRAGLARHQPLRNV